MYKKIISSTILSLAFSNIYATPTPFEGLYANLGAGGINANFDVQQQLLVEAPSTFNIEVPNNASSISSNGGLASIGLGYGQDINQYFVLGAEAVADIENPKFNKNSAVTEATSGFTIAGNSSAQLNNSFALLVKPGFVIDDSTLLYGVIGPRWGHFQSGMQASFLLPLDPPPGAASSNISGGAVSGYKEGLTMGVGIEQALGDNFGFGMEYDYTDYGNISVPDVMSAPIVLNGTNVGTLNYNMNEIKAQTSAVLLNVFYHFS